MMHKGAFLQLMVTLAAISSRLSALLNEVRDSLEIAWRTSFNILEVLDVRSLLNFLFLEQ